MLDKIRNLNPWVFAFLIALGAEILIGLVTELLNVDLTHFFRNLGFVFSLPALKISGYETVQAINDFGGKPEDLSGFAEVAIVPAVGIFIVLILAPFLLLKGYIQANNSENPQKRSWTWYVGAIMIMLALIPAALSATVGTKVYMNTVESSENSRQRDVLRSQLMNLALGASYLLFLLQEKGGGDGSFRNIGTDSEPISLDDLKSYTADSNFEFQIYETISDSMITIVGISDQVGNEEDFQNVNGETGRQQISVEVTPYNEEIFKMGNNHSLKN